MIPYQSKDRVREVMTDRVTKCWVLLSIRGDSVMRPQYQKKSRTTCYRALVYRRRRECVSTHAVVYRDAFPIDGRTIESNDWDHDRELPFVSEECCNSVPTHVSFILDIQVTTLSYQILIYPFAQ